VWLSPSAVYLRYGGHWSCTVRQPARTVPPAVRAACRQPQDAWRIDESTNPEGRSTLSIAGVGISFEGNGT
jgi:hypothetical protein